MEELVIIYTDGACVPNPGKGGWGITMQYRDVIKEFSGTEPQTTNNRMEMQAAIEALTRLKRPCKVRIYSDSKYLVDGFTQWFPNWKKKDETEITIEQKQDYLFKFPLELLLKDSAGEKHENILIKDRVTRIIVRDMTDPQITPDPKINLLFRIAEF